MLKLENVSKYYHSNDTVALGLRRVNLEFSIGEFIAVTGESGSGKSTLLNIISGLDTYEEGELYIGGEETSYFTVEDWENYRRQYIGFVFQNYNIIDSYSVLENVMLALKLQGYNKEKRKERALELIDRVGLSTHIHHKASKLSGGQKQRAVIARALAKDCPIIVCDEPTGNLDSESSENIIRLLHEISQDKLVIVVTHNYDEIKEYATRRIRLFDGEVIEDKKKKTIVQQDKPVKLAPYKVGFLGLVTLALRNLIRTPRRTIFTLIIFLFVTSVFTFVYGNYVTVLNEELAGSSSSFFNNANQRRIIVTKYDETPFTNQELSTLEDITGVVYLNQHDVINDLSITIYSYDNNSYLQSKGYYINPAITLTDSDLKSGRLPRNNSEVVVESTTDYKLGDTIQYAYFYPDLDYNASEQDLIEKTMQLTVVGITNPRSENESRQMYFHTSFIEDQMLLQKAYYFDYIAQEARAFFSILDLTEFRYHEGMMYVNSVYVIDNTLNDFEFIIHTEMLDQMRWYYMEENNIPYEDRNTITNQQLLDYTYYFYTDSQFAFNAYDSEIVGVTNEYIYSYYHPIYVNQATFDEIFTNDIYQISLHTVDRFDALDVIDELEDLGYNAIYPTNSVPPEYRIAFFMQSLIFGFFMVIITFSTYFIVYLILKNIQTSKKKDYLIFRSIGASKKNLNTVTILELMITMLSSYIIVYLVLVSHSMFNYIPYMGNIIKYFTIGNYIFLLALLVYLTYILAKRFNKRIFNRSVITALRQE